MLLGVAVQQKSSRIDRCQEFLMTFMRESSDSRL